MYFADEILLLLFIPIYIIQVAFVVSLLLRKNPIKVKKNPPKLTLQYINIY